MSKLISKILQNPALWGISQKIFGDDKQKMELYRSVIKDDKKKLLDFGCSNGNTFPAFTDFNYFGYDNDKIMIKDARVKYKKYKNAHFYNIDILKDHPMERNFDYILFALTGHHIEDNTLIKIFPKLTQILKKHGKIIYFDSIRTQEDSVLLTTILNFDQGKFIRTLKEYNTIKMSLPKNLKMRKSKIFHVKGAFMPQPKYLFWELEKI